MRMLESGTGQMSPEEQQERVKASFAKRGLMTTLGATLEGVSPGMVEIVVSPNPAILQQHALAAAGARGDLEFCGEGPGVSRHQT